MAYHLEDFSYEEIRRPDGNYFDSWAEAQQAGYDDDQIWSVVAGNKAWTYGPPHHYVNVIGFIATTERHDHDTYYEETL